MKKILILMLFCMGVVNVSAMEPENVNSSVTSQGAKWDVIVTYNIYYSFYQDRDGSGSVGDMIFQRSESITFQEYADTADEAESMAKDECYQVCSRTFGKYVGLRAYKGSMYHAFEYRKVATARAKMVP